MTPSLPLILLVAVAATYSVTMLVTSDKLTDPPREWLLTKLTGHGYTGRRYVTASSDGPSTVAGHLCACTCVFGSTADVVDHVYDARQELMTEVPLSRIGRVSYLLTCPWCVSLWVAVPVVWSAWCFGDRGWWFVPAMVFAARAVTGTWARYARPAK